MTSEKSINREALQPAANSILTAEFDNPAASKETQEGGVGGGHVSFWHHDMAHWRKEGGRQTYTHTKLKWYT